ncbi:hypothetical protein SAMD00019534_098860 [Acytostelium subglobosum LB1]|uniref:hypothetical protein n=1 Tax=Acytostelium subglobosum LB1 TaxID=1410327 RepID=UPI000644B82E|nr:hypothetical protein SAMD00019534_098860 [Acytostelium subglobosum LB1]GAM26711.1 hypothetical protein SAMD00019534_098860 [Acytostelium subglobosum LB1]|eukprot:XP_012750372.1 hypothetical protein SAMD00019534_098860 [Acytostelium subglobosum LB1]
MSDQHIYFEQLLRKCLEGSQLEAEQTLAEIASPTLQYTLLQNKISVINLLPLIADVAAHVLPRILHRQDTSIMQLDNDNILNNHLINNVIIIAFRAVKFSFGVEETMATFGYLSVDMWSERPGVKLTRYDIVTSLLTICIHFPMIEIMQQLLEPIFVKSLQHEIAQSSSSSPQLWYRLESLYHECIKTYLPSLHIARRPELRVALGKQRTDEALIQWLLSEQSIHGTIGEPFMTWMSKLHYLVIIPDISLITYHRQYIFE